MLILNRLHSFEQRSHVRHHNLQTIELIQFSIQINFNFQIVMRNKLDQQLHTLVTLVKFWKKILYALHLQNN